MLLWNEVKEHATDWLQVEEGVIRIGCPVCDGPDWMVVSERADGSAYFICPQGCSPVKIERLIGRLLRAGTNGVQPYVNGAAPSIRSAAELMTKRFAPIRWAVPDMIGEGLTVLAGGPKAGKSYMALAVAVAIAMGGRVFGKLAVEQGRVLYLALEDNERRFQSRLHDILQGDPMPDLLDYSMTWPQVGQGCEEAMHEWLDDHDGGRLIIVDVFQKIRPPRPKGADAYDDDYRVTSALQRVAMSRTAAILALHHTRKMVSEDPFDMISGSNGMQGAADGMQVLMRQRDQKEAVLHFIGRDIGGEAWAMEWDSDIRTWHLLGDAQKHVVSSQRIAVARLLEDTQEDLSPTDVSSMLNIDYGIVKRMLLRMAREMEILKVARGRYRAIKKIEDRRTDL